MKQAVADRSGARVHADDPPAPVEQDGARAQVIEARLDPLREYDASGRGDGANPFDMVAYPFEFADFPVFNLSRPPLDAAANLARHKLEFVPAKIGGTSGGSAEVDEIRWLS